MRYDHHPEVRHLSLRNFGRIAIWNREWIIVLISMAVWVADLAFLIHGEYPLPITEFFLQAR